jgi:hypothetical protein
LLIARFGCDGLCNIEPAHALKGVKTLISLRTEPVMVLILLEVRAELDNVNSIRLPKGTTYTLTVKNSSGEDTREGVEVSSADEVELAGSRGTANFALKWARDARQQANMQVVEDIKGLPLRYTAEDGQNFAPIVGFECRGLEPIAWFPSDGFFVEGTGSHTFQDVDLSDDWADFDEKTGNAVSVMDLEWRFTVRR